MSEFQKIEDKHAGSLFAGMIIVHFGLVILMFAARLIFRYVEPVMDVVNFVAMLTYGPFIQIAACAVAALITTPIVIQYIRSTRKEPSLPFMMVLAFFTYFVVAGAVRFLPIWFGEVDYPDAVSINVVATFILACMWSIGATAVYKVVEKKYW